MSFTIIVANPSATRRVPSSRSGTSGIQKFKALLLDKRKSRRDASLRHLAIHCAIWQLERMGCPVVAIDALHLILRKLRQIISLCIAANVGSRFAGVLIRVLNPG